jgi:pimeloyl-ACP methyl ester carboxylesterase
MRMASLSLTLMCMSAGAVDLQGPLTIKSEGSFFIGGTVKNTANLGGKETDPKVTQEGQITTGQMYVQYQVPASADHLPIVLVHGGGLSGQAYDTTPDGRMGWMEYFLRNARPVYAVDQAGRGRSGFDATVYNAARSGSINAHDAPPIQIIGHEFAWTWFRIGPKFGTPFADTQFPVEAVDAFYKMWIPDLNAALPDPNPSYADLAALSVKLGGAVLIGHSESFMFPERAALLKPANVKGIISLESGYACNTSFTAQEKTTLAGIPILIVFADHQADAPEPFGSRWTTSMAQCRAFAASIRQEGGDVTFLHLPEAGIHGNSHMFMLDKNNLQIADLLLSWIDQHVEHAAKY